MEGLISVLTTECVLLRCVGRISVNNYMIGFMKRTLLCNNRVMKLCCFLISPHRAVTWKIFCIEVSPHRPCNPAPLSNKPPFFSYMKFLILFFSVVMFFLSSASYEVKENTNDFLYPCPWLSKYTPPLLGPPWELQKLNKPSLGA